MTEQSTSITMEATGLPLARRSFPAILGTTFRLYARHGAAFTRTLISPVLQITLYGYSCLIVGYLLINYAAEHPMPFVEEHPWISSAVVLSPSAGLIYMFCRAFRKYLDYFTSLNINVVEALQNRTPDFRGAFRAIRNHASFYTALLVAYCAVALFPAILWIVLIVPALLLSANAETSGVGMALSLSAWITALLAIPVTCVALLFFTLVFQITAFETVLFHRRTSLLDNFGNSARMAWKGLWKTLGLQIALIVITSLIPSLLGWLLRVTNAAYPLDVFHEWVYSLMLKDAAPVPGVESPIPFYDQIYGTISSNVAEISRGSSDILLTTLFNGLMLPLGTIAFTLLYLDIKARQNGATTSQDAEASGQTE